MALMDETFWRGTFCRRPGPRSAAPAISGTGISGTGARFGGTANLEAFTDTRWVTIRGDIAPYPF